MIGMRSWAPNTETVISQREQKNISFIKEMIVRYEINREQRNYTA